MEAVESFDAGMPINGIWIAADQELTTKVSVNPLTPNSAWSQNSRKIPNFFSYILKNDKYHWKVLPKSFRLNGRTIGFHPQTQKLEPPCTA